jgi:hypothetical protein
VSFNHYCLQMAIIIITSTMKNRRKKASFMLLDIKTILMHFRYIYRIIFKAIASMNKVEQREILFTMQMHFIKNLDYFPKMSLMLLPVFVN